MLRINLLPPYIYEGAKRRNVSILWVVIVLVVAGGFVYGQMRIAGETAEIKAESERLTPDANKADQLQQEANATNTKSQTIRDKRDFVKNVQEYDTTTYPPLVDNVRQYTIRQVLYSSFQPAGKTIAMSAYAPSLADVGQFMMYMERNRNIDNVSVALNNIPSFPLQSGRTQPAAGPAAGYGGVNPMNAMMGMMGGGSSRQQASSGLRPPGAAGYDFLVTLTLSKAIPGAPSYGGAQQGGGGGGFGGMASGPGTATAPGMGVPMMMPSAPGGGGGAVSAPGLAGGGRGRGRAGAEE